MDVGEVLLVEEVDAEGGVEEDVEEVLADTLQKPQ